MGTPHDSNQAQFVTELAEKKGITVATPTARASKRLVLSSQNLSSVKRFLAPHYSSQTLLRPTKFLRIVLVYDALNFL